MCAELNGLPPCEGAMIGILLTALLTSDYNLPRPVVEDAFAEAMDVADLLRK